MTQSKAPGSTEELPALKVQNARIRWQENGLPYSLDFEDTYHSSEGAPEESRHVFIAGSNLVTRWEMTKHNQNFVIAELGFGCGLNFLETWRSWRASDSRPKQLQYIAFELHPLSHSDLARSLIQWPELAPLATQLLHHYPEHGVGCHRLHLDDGITLDLYYGDALQQMDSISQKPHGLVDAWYLDGFSPAVNPSLWDTAIAENMARLARSGATVASYSVAGSARRALNSAGFSVEKRIGFGKKRHCLFAEFTANKTQRAQQSRHTKEYDDGILVIGSGLAGIYTALALLRRGARVTLVDAADGPFAAASGIPQIALRPRLFAKPSISAGFFLKAFHYARRQYNGSPAWHPTGMLQLATAQNRKKTFSTTELASLYDERLVRAIDYAEASTLAGIPLAEPGLYSPEGGWIDAQKFATSMLSQLANDDNCTTCFDSKIINLQHQISEDNKTSWIARNTNGIEYKTSSVVLCNSHGASELLPESGIRLQLSRGQITEVMADTSAALPHCVVSGERSLFPASQGRQLIAASYQANSCSMKPNPEDDKANLDGLNKLLGFKERRWQLSEPLGEESCRPRVAIRSAGEDFLPILGRAPDASKIRDRLSILRRNARASADESDTHIEGLFINIGHGSNGVASCPLSGAHIASLIFDEPSPLSAAEEVLLSPSRFLIRDLKRQRT